MTPSENPKPDAGKNAGASNLRQGPSSGKSGESGSLLLFIEFLRARLKSVIRVCLAALVLLVIIDALPFLVDKHHAHTKAEHYPAFWAAFGFIACVLIVYVSKWFGHSGIMTREDYYDE